MVVLVHTLSPIFSEECRKNNMASNPKERHVTSKSNNIVNVRWGSVEDFTLVKSLLKLAEDGGWKSENG